MNNQNNNLILFVALSFAIIFGWQYFFERPKLTQQVAQHQQYNQTVDSVREAQHALEKRFVSREEALKADPRVIISTPKLYGSINLKGLRFDDLVLNNFHQTLDPNSGKVILLSPSTFSNPYFAEIGWYSVKKDLQLPNQSTIWTADNNELSVGKNVNLTWVSPDNIIFKVILSIDENYMLAIEQQVINNTNNAIALQPYGLIHKSFDSTNYKMSVVHEGISGVIGESLSEYSYKDIKDKKKISNNIASIDWLGISDKYWLSALIPDKKIQYNSNYTFAIKDAEDRYQADFIGPQQIIASGETYSLNHQLFSGAKELSLLDDYEDKYKIKLFDRTVDFGWFYVITKPLYFALHYFHEIVGNFGISIMIVTVIVKLLMLGMANKSFRSMKKMKELQPEIDRLRTLYGADKMRFNQEVMNLYKVNKVNPLSGCLPIFIQIPVFFSLYKVLNVSIEMRHAPFYGWIKDLSAPDPTSFVNLFGLLPFTPPSFLMIGIWPILMAVTMFFQQRLSPPPSDPAQAQVMKFLPLIFLFMFSSFPAGLLIYWTWNNILSIAQQYYINRSNSKA